MEIRSLSIITHTVQLFSKWISLNSVNLTRSDILPGEVPKSVFLLIPLVRYLFPLTTCNRYQPRDSNGNFFFTTTSRNISIVRYGMSLVAIVLLVFVSIHWIRWIQLKSFRENSIVSYVNTRAPVTEYQTLTITKRSLVALLYQSPWRQHA